MKLASLTCSLSTHSSRIAPAHDANHVLIAGLLLQHCLGSIQLEAAGWVPPADLTCTAVQPLLPAAMFSSHVMLQVPQLPPPHHNPILR